MVLAYMVVCHLLRDVRLFASESLNPLHLLALLTLLVPRVLVYSAKRRATGVRRGMGFFAVGLLSLTAITTATHRWLVPWPAVLRWQFPYGMLWSAVLLALGAMVFFTSPARKKS